MTTPAPAYVGAGLKWQIVTALGQQTEALRLELRAPAFNKASRSSVIGTFRAPKGWGSGAAAVHFPEDASRTLDRQGPWWQRGSELLPITSGHVGRQNKLLNLTPGKV